MNLGLRTAMPRPLPLRSERLLLLPNDAMRARRCPKAVFILFAWESLLGFVLSWPFAAIVRGAYGSHPQSDAVLWDAGGLTLLDLLVRRLPALGSLVAHAACVILFVVVVGLFPLAAAIVSVGFTTPDRKPPSLRSALQSAVAAMGPFAALLATSLLLQGSLVAAVMVAAGLVDSGFERSLGERGADLLAIGLLVLGAMAVATVGILQDLARAAIVRFGAGVGQALRTALSTWATGIFAILWSWTWRAATSLVPIAFGVLLATRLGGRRGVDLYALFAIHQLILAVRAALRVSWLAKAIRVIDARGA